MSTAHLDATQWLAFFEQSMSPADREAALDHIASCPRCAGLFKTARAAALNAVGTPAAQPRRAPRARLLIPVAATLAIGIVGAIVISRTPDSRIEVVAPPPASSTPPPSTPAPAPRPALVKPPVVIGAEQLLPMRGNDGNAEYLRALADALRPYEGDDFAAAIALLDPLAKAHPDKFEPVFYLGASLMMAGRSADAVPVLERAAAMASAARRDDAARALEQARRTAQP